MKLVLGIAAVCLAAWLQVSFFGHFRPLGIMPNVVLIVVVVMSLWSNATPALMVALGGGLLLDMAAGDGTFGLRMAFMVVVVLAIVAGRQLGLHSDSFLTGLAAVLIGTLLYNAAVLLSFDASMNLDILSRIGRELAVNAVLVGLLYLVRANLEGYNREVLNTNRRMWR